MRVTLASLVLMVGCHSAPVQAPGTATGGPLAALPADPGVAASPYDAALDLPRLSLRAPDLDLEALAQKYTVYHVDVDLSSLTNLDRAEARQVQLALAADPRWRVGVWDGAVVAFQRSKTEQGWTVPRHGFHDDDGGVWRTGVRFSAWAVASEWNGHEALTRTDSATRRLALRAFSLLRGPAAGLEATALTVSGPTVAMDLFEATSDRTRPRTSEALSTLPMLLDRLHDASIATAVWDPGKADAQRLDVRAAGPGLLEISARVQTVTPGWTWVRLLDAAGRAWEEPAVAAGTRELTWGDSTADRRTFLHSQLPVPSGPGFRGTAEVWQAPLDGGRPVQLATYKVAVPAR